MNRYTTIALGALTALGLSAASDPAPNPDPIAYDTVDSYDAKATGKRKSLLFEHMPDSVYPDFDTLSPASAPIDTLRLPDKHAKDDSLGKEFRKYWEKYQKQEGFDQLKGQADAHDINKSKIPHWYLFDSTVVIYPGWFYIQW